MPNALQQAGAAAEPSNFAPLNTDRIFTGLWTNRNPLRDAATSNNEEKYYGARQDSILGGYNSEISAKLTLRRRFGSSVYNSNVFDRINRFYSFNTFTLTDEAIRVLADTATDVWDTTNNVKTSIWHKSAGALSTYFLGVGNILYFTNGVENKQWDYIHNTVSNWGIAAPTTAPSADFPIFTGYGSWLANTVFSRSAQAAGIVLLDPNGNIQVCTHIGNTGTGSSLAWNTTNLGGTIDGGVTWQNRGNGLWTANHPTSGWDILYHQSTDGVLYFYYAVNNGATGASPPSWLPGLNSITLDNGIQWQNIGRILQRPDIGDGTLLVGTTTIEDAFGNIQVCIQAGKTGSILPNFSSIQSAFTSDPSGNAQGAVVWQNTGALGPVQYGYAYMNTNTDDISNMSPPSNVIATNDGHAVVVQGTGSGDPQVNSIVIFRTLHGGSTFLYLTQIANPGAVPWAYTDTTLDANLNVSWQALTEGEGTPLPIGATCLEWHLGRIFAAVGNVVYASSGPDAAAGGASGNAGFDTTFTCQSKITRFWVTTLGLIVFTVRDSYIILGNGADQALYMIRWIANIPLLSYDNFSEFLTTAYMLTGKRMVLALDPSAGIVEVSQPIADLIKTYNPKTSYTTFHSQESGETALYVADGAVGWYRFAPTSAPESGSNWSPQAKLSVGTSAVQSVETSPGIYELLIGPPAGGGPILKRDLTVNTDNSVAYPVKTRFGSVVVAQPGELAALAWMTLEAEKAGTAPALSIMLSEINPVPNVIDFEAVPRTRQDPPNLPPSQSLYSNRHSLMQNQMPTWCRHFQFEIDWPAEDAANELLTFTIFGQLWQEMRSQ